MQTLDQIAPAAFHTLSHEQLSTIMDEARTVIHSGTATLDEMKRAGTRLHYASLRRDNISLAYGDR